MRIGDLAARTGVPPRLLRHYEDQGLLTPDRAANGYRDYDESDADRVTRIRGLVDTGVPLRLVRRILPYLDGAGAPPLADTDPDLVAELERYHDVIDARVRCLARNRDALATYLDTVRAGAPPGHQGTSSQRPADPGASVASM